MDQFSKEAERIHSFYATRRPPHPQADDGMKTRGGLTTEEEKYIDVMLTKRGRKRTMSRDHLTSNSGHGPSKSRDGNDSYIKELFTSIKGRIKESKRDVGCIHILCMILSYGTVTCRYYWSPNSSRPSSFVRLRSRINLKQVFSIHHSSASVRSIAHQSRSRRCYHATSGGEGGRK